MNSAVGRTLTLATIQAKSMDMDSVGIRPINHTGLLRITHPKSFSSQKNICSRSYSLQ